MRVGGAAARRVGGEWGDHAAAARRDHRARPSPRCPFGAVAALWFIARYAAGVDPESAGRWLALAERIRTELDTGRSPEEVLREEAMAVLGITDLGRLLEAAPPFDPTAALDDAAAWVASRSPTEIAPREHLAQLASPTSL